MAELDLKDRTALDRFVEDLRGLHGDALIAALLTGEAASAGYRPKKSPLATVVVLREVTPDALRRTRGRISRWRRRRIGIRKFQALNDHYLTDIGLDRSQIVSKVEEIIETGGQPA